MSNIIPFTEAGLPSTIVGRQKLLDVNKDIVTAAQFPSLSIKGKVFTLVQDSERKPLTKVDQETGEQTPVQHVSMAFLRINMGAKNWYSKKFTEGDSEGQRPDCSSIDGIAPLATSPNKQAEKCALCKHNQWGSRVSDDNTSAGKACSDHARIAIADPKRLDKPLLLRAPAASLKPLKDALKMVKTRGLQYNEVVFRVGFDMAAPSPKLTFKPVGVLPDEDYAKACELFESDVVRAICGLDGADEGHAAPAPAPAPVEVDELDAALAKRAIDKAKAPPPAAKVEVPATPIITDDDLAAAVEKVAPSKTAVKAKPKVDAPAPAPAPVAPAADAGPSGDALLDDLEGLLGAMDD
jgi:hypothetical protein